MSGSLQIVAGMISCRQRDAVRAETLADLGKTDWGEHVSVVIDQSVHEVWWRRIEETFLRLLNALVESQAEFSLLLEDDIHLNPCIRHNLERWPPLVAAATQPGGPFLGSLFHCGQPVIWRDEQRRASVAAPEGFWGAQALVLSRRTAQHVLRRWQTATLPHDIQLPALAAELSPVYFHTPSLAQQRDVRSTWGLGGHRAADYDARFVAPEPQNRSRHGLAYP
jgi:hypothetical protein